MHRQNERDCSDANLLALAHGQLPMAVGKLLIEKDLFEVQRCVIYQRRKEKYITLCN